MFDHRRRPHRGVVPTKLVVKVGLLPQALRLGVNSLVDEVVHEFVLSIHTSLEVVGHLHAWPFLIDKSFLICALTRLDTHLVVIVFLGSNRVSGLNSVAVHFNLVFADEVALRLVVHARQC